MREMFMRLNVNISEGAKVCVCCGLSQALFPLYAFL